MPTPLCIALIVSLVSSVDPGPQSTPSRTAAQNAPLRIVVISGEDAVNVIQQRTAVAPVVEVRDRNNQPVAGAIVTFTIQGGRGATFAGANALTVTTNAAGQAAVTSLTPTATGAVQINVAAAFQGQSATAAIAQTNFATAAEAASASSASSGSSGAAGSGGGGIGPGTITAITLGAAGAAGAYYGYKKYQEGDAPVVENVTASPDVGLQGATPISLGMNATWHGEGATYSADFGDGSIVTVSADFGGDPRELVHVYTTAGTFTIRLTLTDAWDRASTAKTTITIKSMTGRWNLGSTGSFYTLTQNAGSLSGSFTTASGAGSGSVSGTIRAQTLGDTSPNVLLSVTPSGAGSASTFTGTSGYGTADFIGGTFTSGATASSVQLLRQ